MASKLTWTMGVLLLVGSCCGRVHWPKVHRTWEDHSTPKTYGDIAWHGDFFNVSYEDVNKMKDHCTSFAENRHLVVPDRFHMVLSLTEEAARNPDMFGFTSYLAIKSIQHNARPADGVYVHYTYEPTGPWWKLAKPLVKEVKHPHRTIFFGNKIPYGEHRSDVMRLLVLERYGGVYIDHDTLVLRSFKPLYHQHFVMFREGKHAYYNNGIMVSSPYSRFVIRMAAQYSSYDNTSWTRNSVEAGVRLAAEYPHDVCVMPPNGAHWPLWNKQHTEMLWQELPADVVASKLQRITDVDGHRKPVFAGNAQYAQHYWWRSAKWFGCAHTRVPNITYIRTVDTVMNHLMRPIFHDVKEGDWPPLEAAPCTKGTKWWWEETH